MKKWKRVQALFLSLVLAAALAGCGSSNAKTADSSYEYYEEPMEAGMPLAAGGSSNYASSEEAADYEAEAGAAYEYREDADADNGMTVGNEQLTGQKIVYTANLEMQTLEYAETVAAIRSRIAAAGGFIESESESSNDYNWYYEYADGSQRTSGTHNLFMAVRIPSGPFSGFLDGLDQEGKVISRSVSADNISQSYASLETTRKAQETELERLLQMMEKAETIEDMIAVEARLTEVERSLNATKTTLAAMDKDVEYSTVYINLQEVRRYSVNNVETPFVERLKRAAQNSIENFVEFAQDIILYLVENWPFLLFWIAVIVIAVRLIRGIRRRRAARRQKKQEKEAEKQAEKQRLLAKVQADLNKDEQPAEKENT